MHPLGLTDFTRGTHGAHASRLPPNVCNFAGTARAPLVGVRERTHCVTSRNLRYAPRRRGRRPRRPLRRMTAAAGWLHPFGPTNCTRVTHGAPASRPPPNASNPAGAARAPFYAGVRSCPSSHAGRAWKPSPTV